jgi:hypothetical protein
MRLKYQILHARCGCIVHIEWDEDDLGRWRAIDPDAEVIAADEPDHAQATAAREVWRAEGRAEAKWPSTIERSGLKRQGCADHWRDDHHEHLARLRETHLGPGQKLILLPDRSTRIG